MSQSNTIHLGDHETDCEICKMNCGCDVCTRCAVCKSVIDFDNEGGHIYPNGETLCPSCEADDEEV
jgi:hypothetical protein